MELKPAYLLVGLAAAVLAACSGQQKSDAYGQFEADEITVSAQVPGKLLKFGVREGNVVGIGQEVGLIDTVQLHLKKNELKAQMNSVGTRTANIDARMDVLCERLASARIELKRAQSLREDGAATAQQLDRAESEVRVLEKELKAAGVEKLSVREEIGVLRARIAQLDEQISDAIVISPVTGTVLRKYVEPSELVQQGQPLFKVARLDTLELRAYISGAQLPSVRLGQSVEVLVDRDAKENRALGGTISWIASEAEFTPRMIQTKEERVTQVYAVKVRVPNPEGILKIGMPGEVNF